MPVRPRGKGCEPSLSAFTRSKSHKREQRSGRTTSASISYFGHEYTSFLLLPFSRRLTEDDHQDAGRGRAVPSAEKSVLCRLRSRWGERTALWNHLRQRERSSASVPGAGRRQKKKNVASKEFGCPEENLAGCSSLMYDRCLQIAPLDSWARGEDLGAARQAEKKE